jgi:hypothetical protein
MTPALRMAGLAAEQLQWAERNHHWAYLEKLLELLKEMHGRVIRLERGYSVQFYTSGYQEPDPDPA